MIDYLFSRPILTISQLEASLNIPYIAAKRFVEKLVDTGVLREMTGYVRNRIFRADEIFMAMETVEQVI